MVGSATRNHALTLSATHYGMLRTPNDSLNALRRSCTLLPVARHSSRLSLSQRPLWPQRDRQHADSTGGRGALPLAPAKTLKFATGGWKDHHTVMTCYIHPHEETLRAVVERPRSRPIAAKAHERTPRTDTGVARVKRRNPAQRSSRIRGNDLEKWAREELNLRPHACQGPKA